MATSNTFVIRRHSDAEHRAKLTCCRATQYNALTWQDVLRLWSTSHNFRQCFIQALVQSPFKDFYWECPPVQWNQLESLPFECTLVDAGGAMSGKRASPEAFLDQFSSKPARHSVISFPNQSNDATLIVPKPLPRLAFAAYGSLAAFTHNAPLRQQHQLWTQVGKVMQQELEGRNVPIWLSTAGHGVPWLHIRLDGKPKYYRCSQYKHVQALPEVDLAQHHSAANLPAQLEGQPSEAPQARHATFMPTLPKLAPSDYTCWTGVCFGLATRLHLSL